jgi:predicted small secreted protein
MKAAFTALVFVLAAAASACNTVKGAGQDVEKVGEGVQDVAKDAK